MKIQKQKGISYSINNSKRVYLFMVKEQVISLFFIIRAFDTNILIGIIFALIINLSLMHMYNYVMHVVILTVSILIVIYLSKLRLLIDLANCDIQNSEKTTVNSDIELRIEKSERDIAAESFEIRIPHIYKSIVFKSIFVLLFTIFLLVLLIMYNVSYINNFSNFQVSTNDSFDHASLLNENNSERNLDSHVETHSKRIDIPITLPPTQFLRILKLNDQLNDYRLKELINVEIRSLNISSPSS